MRGGRRVGPVSTGTSFQAALAAYGRGDLAGAERACRQALQRDNRNFDARHLLGVIAIQSGRLRAGISLIEQALVANPRHVQGLANLGNGYAMAGRHEDALEAYQRAIELAPEFVGVLGNRATVLQGLGRYEEAAESFQQLLARAPDFDFALGSMFVCKRHAGDFRDFAHHARLVMEGVAAGRNVERPFPFLSVSGSADAQLKCAVLQARYLCSGELPTLWHGERYSHDRIRLAYVSADFRDHVVLPHMVAVFEAHDRSRFQTLGIGLAAGDQSEVLKRAKCALDQFADVSGLSDQAVAELLREREVDIAIDLTGYTQGCRPGIFARRPCPLHVSLFGYPGTMGASFIDYLIADEFVVPSSHERFYTEKIARLPGTFQVNGPRTGRPCDSVRRDAGLPEAGVVLCSFNNTYKLNPAFLDIWARILRSATDSVLWLLAETPAVERRLRLEFATRAVPENQVAFAPRVPYADHLARLGMADLFLDVLPFNAGVTASDALWAGVPVLTCAGEAFASRMAGSVLSAIGFPELITFTLEEYERRAVELARDAPQLAQIRGRLATHQQARPLSDARRYTAALETAYLRMWQRVRTSEPAESFTLLPQDVPQPPGC